MSSTTLVLGLSLDEYPFTDPFTCTDPSIQQKTQKIEFHEIVDIHFHGQSAFVPMKVTEAGFPSMLEVLGMFIRPLKDLY